MFTDYEKTKIIHQIHKTFYAMANPTQFMSYRL